MMGRKLPNLTLALILVFSASGCVSLFSVKKTPLAGGKEQVQYGLLGLDFDDPSILGLFVGDDPDATQLIKLFQRTGEREMSDHNVRMLKKIHELEALLNRPLPQEGSELDFLIKGNKMSEILEKDLLKEPIAKPNTSNSPKK